MSCLTGVSRPEVVRVAREEGLMVLCRKIHIVICERLSTRYPRISAHKGGELKDLSIVFVAQMTVSESQAVLKY